VAFLLDTNVVSEVQRPRPDRRVVGWIEEVPQLDLATSAIVIGEIRRGIELLRRRDASQAKRLDGWAADLVERFGDRILPVTTQVAEYWGTLGAKRPLPGVDGLLLATAAVNGLTFVSREAERFADLGVPVLNPWAAA
jgi:predicted nucleic acid-binding protein